MSSTNKVKDAAKIVLPVLFLLILLSFTDSSFRIFDTNFKKVDLFSELKKPTNDSIQRNLNLEGSLAVTKTTDSTNQPIAARKITFLCYPENLNKFFDALLAVTQKKTKAKIAYYGDSMIEGDLITQDFRNSLQDTFGGVGVGFVPITSITASFRQTILHTFSENWQQYSLISSNSDRDIGISGYSFSPLISDSTLEVIENEKTTSWVSYAPVTRSHLNKLGTAKLYYGRSAHGNSVSISGKSYELASNAPLSILTLGTHLSRQSLKAEFNCTKPITLFGFSFESDSGVYVDNFSFRGNSGMTLTKIPISILKGMNEESTYKLIVLQYGVNVVNNKVTDFSWYERGMTNVIKHFQTSMPDATILIISTGDKSMFSDGNYITDTSVPLLVSIQKEIARKNGVAFWNLYEAMGGYNSMVNWVEQEPTLANKDYTHPNARGAKKIATLLFRDLMHEYRNYVHTKTP